jgi:DNA-binding transcriptional ArsR family regulator
MQIKEKIVRTISAEAMRDKVHDASEVLAALANANRLLILCHLLDGEQSVTILHGKVDIAQSALSQHLGRLRALRLVSTRREAQTIYYSLASDKVSSLLTLIKQLYCPADDESSD